MREPTWNILKVINFRCSDCEYNTNLESKLKDHMKSHHEEDNSSLKCEQCASTFGTKLELDTHEWTVHINNFRCDSCTYVTDKSTE